MYHHSEVLEFLFFSVHSFNREGYFKGGNHHEAGPITGTLQGGRVPVIGGRTISKLLLIDLTKQTVATQRYPGLEPSRVITATTYLNCTCKLTGGQHISHGRGVA